MDETEARIAKLEQALYQAQSEAAAKSSHQKSRQALKFVLTFFVLLFVGGSAAGGYYMGVQHGKSVAGMAENKLMPATSVLEASTQNQAAAQDYSGKYFLLKLPAGWSVDPSIVKPNEPNFLEAARFVTSKTIQDAQGQATPANAEVRVEVVTDPAQSVLMKFPDGEKKMVDFQGAQALQVSGVTGIGSSVYFQALIIPAQGGSYVLTFSTPEATKDQFVSEYNALLSGFKPLAQTAPAQPQQTSPESPVQGEEASSAGTMGP